jgi:hypothetical protein
MARFERLAAVLLLIPSLFSGCARKAPPPGKPDVTPPLLQILYPTPNDTLSDTVRLGIQVSDRSSIRSVRLFVDGNPVASDSTEPYEILWDTSALVDTTHSLYLQATDRWDNTGTSKPLTVYTRNGHAPEPPGGKRMDEREKPE